jgi:hypothetical protein
MDIKESNQNHRPLCGFIGSFIAFIAIFFIVPLFIKSLSSHVALQSCFVLLILSTIYTLSERKSLFLAGLVLIIPFITIDTLSIIQDSLDLMVIAYSFYCLFIFCAIILLARRVLNITKIDTNLIFGAVMIYILAGILWAKLYFIADTLIPNSFHGISSIDLRKSTLEAGYQNQFDLLYYSFTTLATLGIGDILPLHHLTKSLTVLEAIFGQLFLATVIAKVVSVWRQNHSSEKENMSLYEEGIELVKEEIS